MRHGSPQKQQLREKLLLHGVKVVAEQQESLSERSYAAERYLPGQSHQLLIFYSLWKLICRLNANSLQAIKSQTPKRQRRGKIVNNLTYHHGISKCRTRVGTYRVED